MEILVSFSDVANPNYWRWNKWTEAWFIIAISVYLHVLKDHLGLGSSVRLEAFKNWYWCEKDYTSTFQNVKKKKKKEIGHIFTLKVG